MSVTTLLSMYCRALASSLFLAALAYQPMPKLYVDVDAIELIDPLREGFNIILRESFINTYLNAARMPTIYSTVISLRHNGPTLSQILYREDISESRVLQIEGLQRKAWYYVCIEFENFDRHTSRGNTSTSCRVARTLDNFGHKAESSLVDIKVGIVSSDFMEFQLSVEADFPLELTAYLEHGSAQVQSFILTQPKSLRLIFTDLMPGFNYGHLCTIEAPLRSAYSAMGRGVNVPMYACHLDKLMTPRKEGPTTKAEAQIRPYRETLTSDNNSSDAASRHWAAVILAFIIAFLCK